MDSSLVYKLKNLMEGGDLSILLQSIKHDIALSIVQTAFDEKVKREELYMLTKAIDGLQVKLQEYVNEYDKIQESE
ncbi:hypothetical protein [Salmonella phage 7-11]|uniref:Uncharacterized protein n=2 Tax=Moazamivirus TaxID=3044766 RepID=G0X4T9_9CAUD|nr:hypothetical protein SaPh711_gp006 [Salmonella phage 7-11]YP_010672123.1 hypothetical protein PQC35_gp025 [Salmonella phage SE131]AEK81921.1 hypothetical protein [Salmonella phage 7-11]AVJ48274.1 hypothetical protein [Salmonella phage SE131]